MANELKFRFKNKVNMTPEVETMPMGGLPRSEKKTKRVIARRLD